MITPLIEAPFLEIVSLLLFLQKPIFKAIIKIRIKIHENVLIITVSVKFKIMIMRNRSNRSLAPFSAFQGILHSCPCTACTDHQVMMNILSKLGDTITISLVDVVGPYPSSKSPYLKVPTLCCNLNCSKCECSQYKTSTV